MTALIDLDAILYRGLFGAKEDNYYRQLTNCEKWLENINDRLSPERSLLFLSSNHNFRYGIYAAYKANRDSERPVYLHDARKYFIKYWGAALQKGLEADDLIAMNHNEETIAVTNDKDMMQLKGNLYNPFTNTLYYIDNPEFHFYKQMCTGDRIDNVPGIKNPAKLHYKNPPNFTEDTATELLKDLSKEEMRAKVQDLYFNQFGDDWYHIYERNAKLLFLKRSEDSEYWHYF